MSWRSRRLSTRLMVAQILVIAVGGITLIMSAVLVAPKLFHEHLAQMVSATPEIQRHAEEAFASSFAISLGLATLASLITAGLISWFLVRRISHPVEDLADAAEAVAAGSFDVSVPDAQFSSELNRLSQSFERMAARLARTDATRTRLMADLAHEVRTPLATLAAYIDGLEDDVLPAEPATWQTMRHQVGRLQRLSVDLRDTAAAEEHALAISLEPLDAGLLARDAVRAAAPGYATKGVALSLDQLGGPAPIMGDPQRIQQVLANLLENALRHTPPQRLVQVAVETDNATVQILVRDEGDGIARTDLEAIFERLHRGDPARVADEDAGSGLGLTIARAIIAEHDGTLVAHSNGPGTGSLFTVALPRNALLI